MTSHFENNWFNQPGAYVLVDGQFGSTGKGLFAAYLAQFMAGKVNKITTNAGPNSGHTAYWSLPFGVMNDQLPSYEKIVTQQLPVASVFLDKMGHPVDTIINAGAIIDHNVLLDELGKWANNAGSRVIIHPSAALISKMAKMVDEDVTKAVAGTGKGIGPALIEKISRILGTKPLARSLFEPYLPPEYTSWDDLWDWRKDVVFVETAQGFSLGINSSRFYPCVTSRECTVQQALADARIPAQMLRKVVATFRTYPIRVGNTESSSGDWYPDQSETTWEAIGVEPELTTVTKRMRRVASWSWTQFRECVATNRPDVLFLNFAQYMDDDEFDQLLYGIRYEYGKVMGREPEAMFAGYGPYCEDIREVDWLAPF